MFRNFVIIIKVNVLKLTKLVEYNEEKNELQDVVRLLKDFIKDL